MSLLGPKYILEVTLARWFVQGASGENVRTLGNKWGFFNFECDKGPRRFGQYLKITPNMLCFLDSLFKGLSNDMWVEGGPECISGTEDMRATRGDFLK